MATRPRTTHARRVRPQVSFPNQEKYTPDPGGSGWWVHNEAPNWQYSPAEDLHFNALEGVFGRFDPITGAWTVVTRSAQATDATAHHEASGGAAANASAPEVVEHVADHSFMQGRRPTQEDRHTMLHDYGARQLKGAFPASFYAVFDGHMGEQCSEFASKNLHKNLAKELKKSSEEAKGAPLDPAEIERCIRDACAATDREVPN